MKHPIPRHKQVLFHEDLFYYNVYGENALNTCFLIHGIGDNAKAFYNIIPSLCNKGFRVISFDLLGCGINNRFSTEYDDNIRILSKLINIEKKGKLVFIGHSMGGLILLQTILKEKIEPSKIITIEPSITMGDKDFFQRLQEPPIGIGFESFSNNNNYNEGYPRIYSDNLLSSNPKTMKANAKTVFENFEKNQQAILKSGLKFDYFYGALSKGTKERKKLQKQKQIKVICLKDSKHWVHIDAEKEFINYLHSVL